jgi:hypothetical protein
MYTGKILVYQNKFNLDLDAIKSQISATEIKEADSYLVSYIDQGYTSIESMYCSEGYNVYQVDNCASSKMIQYSGCLVGALEFDEKSFIDFVSCNHMIRFSEFEGDFENKVYYFLSTYISHYYDNAFLEDVIEELKVNLVNLFYTPNLIEDPIKRIQYHLSNKW